MALYLKTDKEPYAPPNLMGNMAVIKRQVLACLLGLLGFLWCAVGGLSWGFFICPWSTVSIQGQDDRCFLPHAPIRTLLCIC